jgi:DNA-binding CsgD family transcriptional regulator
LEDRSFLELVGRLYEAAACPERWEDFLSLAVRQLECNTGLITVHDLQNRNRLVAFSSGLSDEAVRAYNDYYGALIPFWDTFLAETLRRGSWQSLAVPTVGRDKYLSSEYFNDYAHKQGICWSVIGATINEEQSRVPTGPGTITGLTITRAYEAGELGPEAVQFMERLMPHLKHVVRIHGTMESLRAKAAAATAALDRIEMPFAAVNAKGVVVLMNTKAEQICRDGDGVVLRQRRFSASRPEEGRQLEALVLSAATTGAGIGMHAGGILLIHRNKLQPLQVLVTPFRSGHMLTEEAPCALIVFSDPEAQPSSRAPILSTLYHLTPSECRLADLLLQGFTVARAAERMRVTSHTARFMLKSIFGKTATHRQSELMRFLVRLRGFNP